MRPCVNAHSRALLQISVLKGRGLRKATQGLGVTLRDLTTHVCHFPAEGLCRGSFSTPSTHLFFSPLCRGSLKAGTMAGVPRGWSPGWTRQIQAGIRGRWLWVRGWCFTSRCSVSSSVQRLAMQKEVTQVKYLLQVSDT